MRKAIHISTVVLLTVTVCIFPWPTTATSACEEAYFSPDDFNHERPLPKPYAEFMKSYRLALAGNAMEQRNVAVSYDAGYLVTACPEKALYWYQKAAGNRDPIARNWLARYNKFKQIFDGPEFVVVNRADPLQTLALAPGPAKNTEAGGGQKPHPTSAEKMLDELSRGPAPTSDIGKIVEIGQLVGDLMKRQVPAR